MIIGLTGTFGSGKTTVADYLKSKNFSYITLSDLVREQAQKQDLPIEREILQNIGNKMRKLHGNGYWAQQALKKINNKNNWIIDGIRNPGEVEVLRKIKNFTLIALDAPIEIRIKRITERKGIRSERKHSDPNNIEEIKRLEARDRGEKESETGQQVEKCIELADYKINTNTSIEETLKTIGRILKNKIN
ncbi:MAG: dephospho-CoA kinase [Nanoarchaeota archaeon]